MPWYLGTQTKMSLITGKAGMQKRPVAQSAPPGLLEEGWSRKLGVPVTEKSRKQRLGSSGQSPKYTPISGSGTFPLQSAAFLPSPSAKPRAAGEQVRGAVLALSTLHNREIYTGLTPAYSRVCLLQEAFPGLPLSPCWEQAPT